MIVSIEDAVWFYHEDKLLSWVIDAENNLPNTGTYCVYHDIQTYYKYSLHRYILCVSCNPKYLIDKRDLN